LAERRLIRNGRAFPEDSPATLLLFLAHTFEGLIVRFLVNKLSCLGIPLYPPIILRIVGLGPVFYRADPVAISDWGIFRHLCHHLLSLKFFFLCSFAGLLPKFAAAIIFLRIVCSETGPLGGFIRLTSWLFFANVSYCFSFSHKA